MAKFSVAVIFVILLQIFHVTGEKTNAENMAKLLKKMKDNGVLGDVDDNTYDIMMNNIKKGGDIFAIKDEELKEIRKTFVSGLDTLKKNQEASLKDWNDVTKSLKTCQDMVSKMEEERESWAKTNAKYVKTVTKSHQMITEAQKRAASCETSLKKLKADVKSKDESIHKFKEEIESHQAKKVPVQENSDPQKNKELEELKQKFNTEHKTLQKENNKLSTELKSLKAWNEKMQSKLISLQENKESNGNIPADSEIGTLKKQLQVKAKELSDCKYKSRQFEADLDIIVKSNREMQDDYRKKMKKIESKVEYRELKELRSSTQELIVENENLKMKNEDLVYKIKDCVAENKESDKQIKTLKKGANVQILETCQKELESHKQKLKDSDNSLADYKSKQDQLEVDLNTIVQSNKEMQDDYKKQIKKLKFKADEQLHNLRNSTAEFKKEKENMKVIIEDLLDKLKECKQEIDVSQKKFKNIKNVGGDMDDDKESTDCQLQNANLQSENEKLQSENKMLAAKGEEKHKEYLKTLNEVRTKLSNDNSDCIEKLDNVEEELKDTKLSLESTSTKAADTEDFYMKEIDSYVMKLLKKTKEAEECRTGKTVDEKLWLKKKNKMEKSIEEISNERDAMKEEVANLKKNRQNSENGKANVKLEKDHKQLKADYEELYNNHQVEKDKTEKLQLQHDSLLDKCGKSSNVDNKLLEACNKKDKELRVKYQDLKASYQEKLLKHEDKLEYYTKELEICNTELQSKSIEEDKAINAKIVAESLFAKKEDKLKEQILLETSKVKQDGIDLKICTQNLNDLKHESNVKINNCNTKLAAVKNEISRVQNIRTKLEKDIVTCETDFKKYLDKELKAKDKVSKHVQQTRNEVNTMVENLQSTKKELKECKQKQKLSEETIIKTGNKLENCQKSVKLISSKHEKLSASCAQDQTMDSTGDECQQILKTMKENIKKAEKYKMTLEKDVSTCEINLKKLATKDLKEKEKVTKYIQETIDELHSMEKDLKANKKLAKENEDKYQNSQETLKIIREKLETCEKNLTSLNSKHEVLATNCKKARKELKYCSADRDTLNAAKEGFESYLLSKDEEFRKTVTDLHKRTKAAVADEVYFRKSFLISVGVCVLMFLYIFCSCIRSRSQNKANQTEDSKNAKTNKQSKKESKKKK